MLLGTNVNFSIKQHKFRKISELVVTPREKKKLIPADGGEEKKKIVQHNSDLTGPLPSHIFHFMPNIFSRASR